MIIVRIYKISVEIITKKNIDGVDFVDIELFNEED